MLYEKTITPFLCLPLIGWAHGVPESTVKAMADASLMDYVYFGAEHMVTGYDHFGVICSGQSELIQQVS